MQLSNDNGTYDTFFDPDLVMPPLRQHASSSNRQGAAHGQMAPRAVTLSTYSGDALAANPRRNYSTDRSLPSAEHLVASLYDRGRAMPEQHNISNTTFVDAMPIHKPPILNAASSSAYMKLLKDPAKRQKKAMDSVDKEALMDEIRTLRKQKNALDELVRKQQTRIARLEELLKSRDKELQNMARMSSIGIPDPTKVTDMMALKQKEAAPTMDYVKGLKHKMKEYYVRNQDLLSFIDRLKESMNFQRMKQLEKNLLIYYDRYNQLRVKNGTLNQHCIELEEELGAVHDKMLQSLRMSKKYPGMRLSEDDKDPSTPTTTSSRDSKRKGPSAHGSFLMGPKATDMDVDTDGKFLSDTFYIPNVATGTGQPKKRQKDQLDKHSMAMQTSFHETTRKPVPKPPPRDDYDPVKELATRFNESKLERERKRLECSFIPDVPEPLEKVEYKILEDEFEEFMKGYRSVTAESPTEAAYAKRPQAASQLPSKPDGNVAVSKDTGVKPSQSKNEKLAQRLVTEIKRSDNIPTAAAYASSSQDSPNKSQASTNAAKKEENPYFAQKQPSRDAGSEKPTSVSGNRPYEDTDNGSTVCDWTSFIEPDMVSRMGATMTEVTSAGGPRQRPKSPLSDTSGLGGSSKPSQNPNSFYPNNFLQADKSGPNQSKHEMDPKGTNDEASSSLLEDGKSLQERRDENKANKTSPEAEESFHGKQKSHVQDALSGDSLNKPRAEDDVNQDSGIVSLESSHHSEHVSDDATNKSGHEQSFNKVSTLGSDDDGIINDESIKKEIDGVAGGNEDVMSDTLNISGDGKAADTKLDDLSTTNVTFDSGMEDNSILRKFPLTGISQEKTNSQFSNAQSARSAQSAQSAYKVASNETKQEVSENPTDSKTTRDYSSLILDSHMFDDPKTFSGTPRDGVKDYSSLQLHSAMFDDPQASKSHPLQNSGDYSSLQLYSGMFDAPDEEGEKPQPETPREPHYPVNPKIKIIESSGTESTAFTIEGTETSAYKASQSTQQEVPSGPRIANPFSKLQVEKENQEIAFSHQATIPEESSSVNSSASHQNPRDGGED